MNYDDFALQVFEDVKTNIHISTNKLTLSSGMNLEICNATVSKPAHHGIFTHLYIIQHHAGHHHAHPSQQVGE